MSKIISENSLLPNTVIKHYYPEPFVCIAFYAFIFSIPFEALNLGIEVKNFTISKLVGFGFLGLALLQPKACFKPPGPVFVCFSCYLFVYVLFGVIQDEQYDGLIFSYFLTIFQMLILFWVSKNMMTFEDIARRALMTLGVACLILAVMGLLGILRTELDQGRVTVSDVNANRYAVILSLGLLAMVGLAVNQKISDWKIRLVTWLSFGVMVIAIVQSGSRGSMAALLIALLVLMLKEGLLKVNPKAFILVFFAVGAMVLVVYQSEAIRVRWEKTIFEGDTAGRGLIYSRAADMFIEKPLFGWGPVRHYYELGSRVGKTTRDPHNVYFWILLEVGLIGAFPFFAGLYLCWRNSLKARAGIHGRLPMALMVFVLIISLKGSIHTGKLFWIVLAYAVASESLVYQQKLNKRMKKTIN